MMEILPKKINILIIEDSEDDGLLLIRKLKKGGYVPTFQIVENEETLKKALHNNHWDVIVSDYSLKGFNGIQALEIYKDWGYDVPFIMVSGMIGEEMAVKAMKLGAHDYVMKDRMERLIPAIEREIKEAELRKKKKEAENAYESTRKKFELLINYSPIGISIIHKNGTIDYFNSKMQEILDIQAGEFDKIIDLINKVYIDKEANEYAKKLWNELVSKPNLELDIVAPPIKNKKGTNTYLRFIIAEIDPDYLMILTEDITKQHEANKALEESQKRLLQIIETIEDIVVELEPNDDSYIVSSINTAFLRYTKLNQNEIVGKNLLDIFPKPEKWIEAIMRAEKRKTTLKWEEELKFPAGLLTWEIYVSPLFDSKGKVLRIIISAHDVTDWIKHERQLRYNEKKSHLIATMVSDCIWEWTIDHDEVWWNEGIKSLFNYEESDINRSFQWFFHNIHPKERDKFNCQIKDLIHHKIENLNIDLQFKCKNGTYRHVNTQAFLLDVTDNVPEKIIGSMIDLTHRKKMEELRIHSLVEGADNERKIIASELHDDLAQNLMLSNLMIQEILEENHLNEKSKKLGEIKELISGILSDTRKMSHSLMPRTLQDFGVVSAIQNIIENVKKGSQLEIETFFNFESERFDAQFEINVYRIVQEAINNIIKHSEATKAYIQLVKSDDYLSISIEDNGKGFDVNKINLNKSIGLKNIENRVLYSDGKLEIESSPGKGTLILVDFPIFQLNK